MWHPQASKIALALRDDTIHVYGVDLQVIKHLSTSLNSRLKHFFEGSGCGAVGRAVASDTRGPRFESSHRQLLLNIYLLLTVCRKDKNKEKEAGNGPFKKKHFFGRNLGLESLLLCLYNSNFKQVTLKTFLAHFDAYKQQINRYVSD